MRTTDTVLSVVDSMKTVKSSLVPKKWLFDKEINI